MNGELLRIVDSIHRDKNIDREIVFRGIETALLSAAKKHFPESDEVTIRIDRETGQVHASHNGDAIAPEVLGRIAAQTAKQIMIQKIREAERDALYDEFKDQVGQLVHGVVQRVEGGMVLVSLGKVEAMLPRSEQIPGESYRVRERVRAIIVDVRKAPQRVKIILSRTHPDFVRRLFEQEIPEIAEGIIEIKALAREAGYRTKVAVVSNDPKVDCVGACVGVRGTRIKNIVEELGGGERIDIVRWSDSLQEMITFALAPAQVEDVILFQMLGRAIVLVKEEQLSLAIGRRGQNVRLASKLASWDIEIMTAEELDEQIEKAVAAFQTIPGMDATTAERLVEHGFLSFDDLSIMGPDELAQIEGIDEQFAEQVIAYAEREAERLEQERAQQQQATPVGTQQVQTQGPQQRSVEQQPEQPAETEATGQEPAQPQPAEPETGGHEQEQAADEQSGTEESEPSGSVDAAEQQPAAEQPQESEQPASDEPSGPQAEQQAVVGSTPEANELPDAAASSNLPQQEQAQQPGALSSSHEQEAATAGQQEQGGGEYQAEQQEAATHAVERPAESH